METGEIYRQLVEHRQSENHKDDGDGKVEPRRRVQRAEFRSGQNHRQTQKAVGKRHAGTVRRTEQEAAAAILIARARTENGKVDWDHRQHAGCQVQRQPAEQD